MRFLYFVFPVILFAAQIVVELTVPQQYTARFHGEAGPHESLQTLVLLFGLFFAARGFFLSHKQNDKLFSFWFMLAFLGCLYTCGEEMSWGQHLFEWRTPAFWSEVNIQHETNLHNISNVFDEIPRAILFAGIMAGGLLFPLLVKYTKVQFPAWLEALRPQNHLAVIALFTLFFKLAQGYLKNYLPIHFERPSEVEEIYIYYFVTIYLADLVRKVSPPRVSQQ